MVQGLETGLTDTNHQNKITADREGEFELLEAKGDAENQQAVAVSDESPMLSDLKMALPVGMD